jgi:ankyrin repeat protein
MLDRFHPQGPWNFWLRDYLKKHYSVNIRDFEGQTPLHHALLSTFQREDKVRALVEAGADVTMRNFAEQSPVSLAKNVDEQLFVFLLITWQRSLLTG